MNTVDELIKKLQAVSAKGHGSRLVALEGCDCSGVWDGDDFRFVSMLGYDEELVELGRASE